MKLTLRLRIYLFFFLFCPYTCLQAADCDSARFEITTLLQLRQKMPNLSGSVVRELDIRPFSNADLKKAKVDCAVFLGTKMTAAQQILLRDAGALVFTADLHTKYDPYRSTLYSQSELEQTDVESKKSLDDLIYSQYLQDGRLPRDVVEAHMRGLHDQSIEYALMKRIAECVQPQCAGVIGIMGGASVTRDKPEYAAAARLAFNLAKSKYLIASGGGPGIMEAANLGAYMSSEAEPSLTAAIQALAQVPNYDPADLKSIEAYNAAARHIRSQYSAKAVSSIGVPTWFYGSEPTNAFATDVAKYLNNGPREERLIQISSRGIVFAYGSAGTRQEIFMAAAQNHYATFGQCSPMVFFGDRFVVEYAAVRVAANAALNSSDPSYYSDLIGIFGTPETVQAFIDQNTPYKANAHGACKRPPVAH